nr:hypothetical protein CFP56_09091 [Quercus suber]
MPRCGASLTSSTMHLTRTASFVLGHGRSESTYINEVRRKPLGYRAGLRFSSIDSCHEQVIGSFYGVVLRDRMSSEEKLTGYKGISIQGKFFNKLANGLDRTTTGLYREERRDIHPTGLPATDNAKSCGHADPRLQESAYQLQTLLQQFFRVQVRHVTRACKRHPAHFRDAFEEGYDRFILRCVVFAVEQQGERPCLSLDRTTTGLYREERRDIHPTGLPATDNAKSCGHADPRLQESAYQLQTLLQQFFRVQVRHVTRACKRHPAHFRDAFEEGYDRFILRCVVFAVEQQGGYIDFRDKRKTAVMFQ